MTAKETAALEKLRDELHDYHVDVKQLATRVESCLGDVKQIKLDLDGENPPNESAPGLKAEVAELRRSRRMILLALRGAWALLLLAIGTIVKSVFGGN